MSRSLSRSLVAIACGIFGTAVFAQSHQANRADPDGAPLAPLQQEWDAPRPVNLLATLPIAAATSGLPATRFTSVDAPPEGDLPRDVAFHPNGQQVIVVNQDTDNVTFFDVATQTLIDTVAVGDCPTSIAVAPNGFFAAVSNLADDTVSILEINARVVVATVPVTGTQPYRVAVSADSARVAVGVVNDGIASSISVIDLGSFSEVHAIPTGPQGMIGSISGIESGASAPLFTTFAIAPDSRTLVLPDRSNAQVGIYDLVLGTQSALVPTMALPSGVAIDAAGTTAVVTHESSNAQVLTRIDLATLSLVGTPIPVGSTMSNRVIQLSPNGQFAMVAAGNGLVFVDLTTGAVDPPIGITGVQDAQVSFDGAYVVTTGFDVQVIDLATRTLAAPVSIDRATRLAMSPIAPLGVALNNQDREDVLFVATDGVTSTLIGATPSGAIDEGDGPHALAVSDDGSSLVSCNLVSGNVTILDAATETVRGYVDTGERCWDARVTPDGRYAVVTNTEVSTVSIIDLQTDTRVADLPVGPRPTELVLSPDGTRAYVTTIAGADTLTVINVAGASSSIVGSLPTGQLGSTTRGTSVSSGIAISPDGGTVAVCVSFPNQLMIVDTATSTEVARLPVGSFPLRAAFSPDSSRIYVANAFGDSVSVVTNAGAASSVLTTVPMVDSPFEISVSPDGAFSYVGSFDFFNPALVVLDNTSNTVVATLPLPSTPQSQHYSAIDDTLYVQTTDGDVVRFAAAGAATSQVDTTSLGARAFDMAFSESLRRAFVAEPGADDGVGVVAFGGVFENYGIGSAAGATTPTMVGTGIPACNEPVSIGTTGGLPNAAGTWLIGFEPLALPIFGATLLVSPLGEFPNTLDGTGDFTLAFVIPNDPALIGGDLFLQGVYIDFSAPFNLVFTDGLAMRIRG